MDPLLIPPGLVSYAFLRAAFGAAAGAGALWLFFDDRMRPALDLITGARSDVVGGLAWVWPLFVWGALITALTVVASFRVTVRPQLYPGQVFARGTWLSLHAGFYEELIFRCLLFLTMVPVLTALNWVTFGGIRWLYESVLIPIADFVTLGLLEPQLENASVWVLGAAILTVNGQFRNGHSYLGLFGWVNSWFIGMAMFYLVFNYGLWAAMAAHVLYDLIITLGAVVIAWLADNDVIDSPYPH
jgi:hypothetical protein